MSDETFEISCMLTREECRVLRELLIRRRVVDVLGSNTVLNVRPPAANEFEGLNTLAQILHAVKSVDARAPVDGTQCPVCCAPTSMCTTHPR